MTTDPLLWGYSPSPAAFSACSSNASQGICSWGFTWKEKYCQPTRETIAYIRSIRAWKVLIGLTLKLFSRLPQWPSVKGLCFGPENGSKWHQSMVLHSRGWGQKNSWPLLLKISNYDYWKVQNVPVLLHQMTKFEKCTILQAFAVETLYGASTWDLYATI